MGTFNLAFDDLKKHFAAVFSGSLRAIINTVGVGIFFFAALWAIGLLIGFKVKVSK
jgi:hypothetical protein